MTLFGTLAIICLLLSLLTAATVRLVRAHANRLLKQGRPVASNDRHVDADVLTYLATVLFLVPAAWLIHYAITALETIHTQL